MTLIELLIVITIMLMVTAAAIPIMMPAVQNRQMRESTRILSSYISSARSRAIENGRPVGVMFERFNGQPFSMVVSSVEVPPPYSGDFANSTMSVQPTAFSTTATINPFTQGDTGWLGLVRAGDMVRLGFHGPLYVLSAGGVTVGQALPTPPWTISSTVTGTTLNLPLVPPAGPQPIVVPFQIFRQPIRSSAPPMQLPEGVVVDLFSSGMGLSPPFGTFVPGPTPPTPPLSFNPYFTFSPGGAVDYVGLPGPIRPTGPLYFLVGRRELMPDANGFGTNDLNVYDPAAIPKNPQLQNFWVAVDYQTGHVSVTENALTNTWAPAAARAFAQTRQSVGGR